MFCSKSSQSTILSFIYTKTINVSSCRSLQYCEVSTRTRTNAVEILVILPADEHENYANKYSLKY